MEDEIRAILDAVSEMRAEAQALMERKIELTKAIQALADRVTHYLERVKEVEDGKCRNNS